MISKHSPIQNLNLNFFPLNSVLGLAWIFLFPFLRLYHITLAVFSFPTFILIFHFPIPFALFFPQSNCRKIWISREELVEFFLGSIHNPIYTTQSHIQPLFQLHPNSLPPSKIILTSLENSKFRTKAFIILSQIKSKIINNCNTKR